MGGDRCGLWATKDEHPKTCTVNRVADTLRTSMRPELMDGTSRRMQLQMLD